MMFRKIVILGLFLVLSIQGKATHFAGAEITYEYIGDSTGIARHYMVRLTAFMDYHAVVSPTGYWPVDYSSSCDPGGTLNLNPKVGFPTSGVPVSGAYSCIPASVSGSQVFKKYVYEADVTLPMNCFDWEFHTSTCCRDLSVHNLSLSGTGYLFKARLNNSYGQNSSPVFIYPVTRQFCLNAPDTINFYQGAVESEGDSLYYYLSHPEEGPHPGTPIPFMTGYSVNSPITTAAGINLNHATGLLRFYPTQSEVVNFKISVDEFRYINSISNWVKIGTVSREIPIVISGSCSSNATNWGISSQPVDSTNFNYTLNAQCGDKSLMVYTSIPYACETLASDGSDFLIYKKDGTLLPVIGATSNCHQGFSDKIILELHDTLSVNDTLYIVSHVGSDFNTLSSYCGYPLDQGDSLRIIVTGCPNIGLAEVLPIVSGIYPNPTEGFVELTFNTNSKKSLELRSLDGALLLKTEVYESIINLYLGEHPKGVYLLRIEEDSKVETRKIIKH